MLNRELEQTLNDAFKEARVKRHEFMTVEHLLLSLLDNDAALAAVEHHERGRLTAHFRRQKGAGTVAVG